MVLVDVVYNHFGPDGNYLHQYASAFFREDRQTPWGAAIDFRRPQVREYFIQNALMWLCDYRCDGLRLDAVHAIDQPDFLIELAQRVRAAVEPGRHVWLVLENEHNQAALLEQGFDAQWNDDGHNALHVLLTGETEATTPTTSNAPSTSWRAAWPRASCSRARQTAMARHAANPAGTCRPALLCCSCRTMTRSATAPWANA